MDKKVWSTADIVENRNNWNLAADEELLKHLQQIAQKTVDGAYSTLTSLNSLEAELNDVSTTLSNTSNRFLALSDTQFIESKIQDESLADQLEVPNDEKVDEDASKKDISSKLIESLNNGFSVLNEHYDVISVSCSDSEDEESEEVLLKPRNPYMNRRLPYIIGSDPFTRDNNVGLIESSSSDESDENEVAEPFEQKLQTPPQMPVKSEYVHPNVQTVIVSSSDSEESIPEEAYCKKPQASSSSTGISESDVSSTEFKNSPKVSSSFAESLNATLFKSFQRNSTSIPPHVGDSFSPPPLPEQTADESTDEYAGDSSGSEDDMFSKPKPQQNSNSRPPVVKSKYGLEVSGTNSVKDGEVKRDAGSSRESINATDKELLSDKNVSRRSSVFSQTSSRSSVSDQQTSVVADTPSAVLSESTKVSALKPQPNKTGLPFAPDKKLMGAINAELSRKHAFKNKEMDDVISNKPMSDITNISKKEVKLKKDTAPGEPENTEKRENEERTNKNEQRLKQSKEIIGKVNVKKETTPDTVKEESRKDTKRVGTKKNTFDDLFSSPLKSRSSLFDSEELESDDLFSDMLFNTAKKNSSNQKVRESIEKRTTKQSEEIKSNDSAVVKQVDSPQETKSMLDSDLKSKYLHLFEESDSDDDILSIFTSKKETANKTPTSSIKKGAGSKTSAIQEDDSKKSVRKQDSSSSTPHETVKIMAPTELNKKRDSIIRSEISTEKEAISGKKSSSTEPIVENPKPLEPECTINELLKPTEAKTEESVSEETISTSLSKSSPVDSEVTVDDDMSETSSNNIQPTDSSVESSDALHLDSTIKLSKKFSNENLLSHSFVSEETQSIVSDEKFSSADKGASSISPGGDEHSHPDEESGTQSALSVEIFTTVSKKVLHQPTVNEEKLDVNDKKVSTQSAVAKSKSFTDLFEDIDDDFDLFSTRPKLVKNDAPAPKPRPHSSYIPDTRTEVPDDKLVSDERDGNVFGSIKSPAPAPANKTIPKKLDISRGLHINVNALMPGAKRPLEVPPAQPDFDENSQNPELLPNVTKVRAKVVTKRRPPTRAGRRKHIEQSIFGEVEDQVDKFETSVTSPQVVQKEQQENVEKAFKSSEVSQLVNDDDPLKSEFKKPSSPSEANEDKNETNLNTIGKLSSKQKININVNALLPNAKRTLKEKSQENKDDNSSSVLFAASEITEPVKIDIANTHGDETVNQYAEEQRNKISNLAPSAAAEVNNTSSRPLTEKSDSLSVQSRSVAVIDKDQTAKSFDALFADDDDLFPVNKVSNIDRRQSNPKSSEKVATFPTNADKSVTESLFSTNVSDDTKPVKEDSKIVDDKQVNSSNVIASRKKSNKESFESLFDDGDLFSTNRRKEATDIEEEKKNKASVDALFEDVDITSVVSSDIKQKNTSGSGKKSDSSRTKVSVHSSNESLPDDVDIFSTHKRIQATGIENKKKPKVINKSAVDSLFDDSSESLQIRKRKNVSDVSDKPKVLPQSSNEPLTDDVDIFSENKYKQTSISKKKSNVRADSLFDVDAESLDTCKKKSISDDKKAQLSSSNIPSHSSTESLTDDVNVFSRNNHKETSDIEKNKIAKPIVSTKAAVDLFDDGDIASEDSLESRKQKTVPVKNENISSSTVIKHYSKPSVNMSSKLGDEQLKSTKIKDQKNQSNIAKKQTSDPWASDSRLFEKNTGSLSGASTKKPEKVKASLDSLFSDDDLFVSKKVSEKQTSDAINKKTVEKDHRTVSKLDTKAKHSAVSGVKDRSGLFDDSEDDLFRIPAKGKQASASTNTSSKDRKDLSNAVRKGAAIKSKNIFDDDEDELFTKKTVAKKIAKSSLFDDGDGDDDLFAKKSIKHSTGATSSVAEKSQKNVHRSSNKSDKPRVVKLRSEVVDKDPLSGRNF